MARDHAFWGPGDGAGLVKRLPWLLMNWKFENKGKKNISLDVKNHKFLGFCRNIKLKCRQAGLEMQGFDIYVLFLSHFLFLSIYIIETQFSRL